MLLGTLTVCKIIIGVRILLARHCMGDGDSSSFKNLVKSNPYDGVASVRKEECLGHVQKRLKKRLSNTTKSSKGLSEAKADRIAHLYGLVIMQHKGESA